MLYRFLSTLCISLLIFSGMHADMPQFPGAQNLPANFPQMSEKDLNEMVNFLDGLSDAELKELEDLGRQVLTDMGYNADTLEPLDPNTPPLKDLYPLPAPVAQPTGAPETPAAPLVNEPTVNTDELEEYLKKFLRHLHNTQHKAQSPILEDRKLSRWIPELRDINFYITVITNSEHLKRLQSAEFESTLKHIKDLGSALITYEPLIIIHESVYDVTDDSYEILGIMPNASLEEIEEAYEKIKKQKSPDTLKEELTKEGASEKDIKRAIKEAQLTMSLVTDAYEKLQDPKTREQIDRERLAHTTQKGTLEKGSQKALDSLVNGISTAIYTYQLLDELEQFLKKYEPKQLEHKKELEKAEAARRKEQEETAKRKATPTPGKFEPEPRSSSAGVAYESPYGGGYPNYGYGNQYYPEYPAGAGYDQPTGAPGAAAPTSGKGAKGTKDATDKKGEKKGGKDKESDKEEKEGGAKGKKGGGDELEDLFKEITKPFILVHGLVNAQRTATDIKKAIKDELVNKAEKIRDALADFADKLSKKEFKDAKAKYKTKWETFIKDQENADIMKYYQEAQDEEDKERTDKIEKIIQDNENLGNIPTGQALAFRANKTTRGGGVKAMSQALAGITLTPAVSDEIEKITEKPTFAEVMKNFKKATSKLGVKSAYTKS